MDMRRDVSELDVKKDLRKTRAVWVVVLTTLLSYFSVPVFATSSTHSVSFHDGRTLTANAWIQPFADFSGCGNWQTSVVMPAGSRTEWIKNVTSFYTLGIGGLFGGLTVNGKHKTRLEWTNSNKQDGSYLSGNVCGGFGSFYVGVDVAGTAVYDGNVRFVNTKI